MRLSFIPDKAFDAYQKQQSRILEFLERNGGLADQKEFDDEFAEFTTVIEIKDGRRIQYPVRSKNAFPLVFQDDHTAILGEIDGGNQWLDLLQHMVRFGVVMQTGWAPRVVYYTPARYKEIEKCSLKI